MKRLLLLTCVLLAVYTQLTAQDKRFNAGVVAGLNFSELEGNSVTDYFGLNAGIVGNARLSKHSQVGMELLFSQNGEYVLPTYYPAVEYGKISLNHIEIPIHFDWLIGVFQRKKFCDWNLNLGVAYTRLIGYKAYDVFKEDVTKQIVYGKKDAFLLQAGTIYQFTPKIGLNFKACLPIRSTGLGWTLQARMIYMFL
jgi:hypothetical protein